MMLAWLVLLLLVLHSDHVISDSSNCVYRTDQYIYDLSPLTITNGSAYGAPGEGGDGYYFFNICGEVTQGACSPHQAVCQVGDAPHGIGDARYVTLKVIDKAPGGVRITYQQGERCYVRDGNPRYIDIDIFCDPNVTSIQVLGAKEYELCRYTIEAKSRHACPKTVGPSETVSATPVNIFLVVHSHDDVGWTSTLQEYYDQKVDSIIDNIIAELQKNESRKFVQVEQAFFVKWWNLVDDTKRDVVRKLVKNGQLTFPIGGWVMPDEATPSYSSLITQLTEGHQFLKETFNYTPSVGWQIDPFGASNVLAEIYKLSNFKGHVIDRIDWTVKKTMEESKSLQFRWRLSNHSSDILTHLLDTLYCFPFLKGLDFKSELSPQDVVRSSELVVDIAKAKAQWTRTPNVLIPVGCDFAYAGSQSAFYEYAALDKIIDYVRAHNKQMNVIGIQYSTIEDYFDALHASDADFPVYEGDFFPYKDKDHSWWTGFYTSRPELKGLIRQSEGILRASDSLFSTVKLIANYNSTTTRANIDSLSQAVSINLHHDAITGTAKPHVVVDYTKILNNALATNYKAIEDMIGIITKTAPGSLTFGDSYKTNDAVPVVVYNSLAWDRRDYVKLTISDYQPTKDYHVTLNGVSVSSQVMKEDGATVLYFKVDLPPLGFRTYFIITKNTEAKDTKEKRGSIKNSFLQLDFTSDSNTLIGVTSHTTNITFAQKFLVYQSYKGKGQQSGAYIFRPEDVPPFAASLLPGSRFDTGEFVSDVYQEFSYSDAQSPIVKQHARIFHDEDDFLGNFVEFAHTVGPLPKLDHGRELTAKFDTSLSSNKTCFTDSNGLRFLERTHNPDLFLAIAGNHYPTVYASYFSDNNEDFSIGFVWDRAHGFSSSYGAAEVMLHRRCTVDDARGLEIPMDDEDVIKPVMRVVFGPTIEILKLIYRQTYLLNFRPIVAIGNAGSEGEWTSNYVTEFSFLNHSLPENIHLVDLKSVELRSHAKNLLPSPKGSQYILRLAHLFDYGEHKTLAESVDLDMRNFFAGSYCIVSMFETHLTANDVIEEVIVSGINFTIMLYPKQIKTFLIDVIAEKSMCEGKCKGGTCITEKCGFRCDCGTFAHFDLALESCVENSLETNLITEIVSLSHFLPLWLCTYLSLICAYSIRSELRKIAVIGDAPKANKVKTERGKIKQFLHWNKQTLENVFFPTNLQSKHQD